MAASVVASVALPISNNFSFAPSMDAYGKLSEYGKLGAWSPLSLFALGEQGAWYDPSDLTTMFQDSYGSANPVSSDGQTVGLILDKSKGLAETATSIDGNMNTATWTKGTGWSSSGTRSITCDGTNGSSSDCSALYTKPTGSLVRWSFNIVSISGTLNVYASSGVNTTYTTSGIKTVFSDSNASFNVFRANAGTTCTITDIKIEVIAGNHAVAPSDAARPLKTSTGAADWTNYDAVDDVLNTTFPSSLGSSCTVCRANVGAAPTILTGQTIGTSYADSTDNAGLIIINRALTAQETTDVTAWLTAKGAT